MRRSSTDESTYHRSPSLDSKDYSFPNGAFRRYSSMYGGQFGAASNSFFGFHTNPGPKATKAKYTTPKGNKYVVFYLDLSFIFLLELKRCSMAHNCLQCIKYLMFVFNLLFWVSTCLELRDGCVSVCLLRWKVNLLLLLNLGVEQSGA